MRQGHVKDDEDISLEKLHTAFRYSHATHRLISNEKVSQDILYLLTKPDKINTNDITPEYQKIILSMLSGLEKAGTEQLEREPPDNETSPPPSGYDESLFTRESLPPPRTQKFRKTPKEMEQYFQKLNADNLQEQAKIQPQDPKKSIKYREQGTNYYHKTNMAMALKEYTKAIQFDNTSTTNYTDRAATYLSSGLPQMAASDCEKALIIDPGCIRAYSRLGNSLIDCGKPIEALAMFEKAVQIDSRSNVKERLNQVLSLLYQYKFNDEDLSIRQKVEKAKETELGKEILSKQRIEIVYSSKRFRQDLEDWIENRILVGPAIQ